MCEVFTIYAGSSRQGRCSVCKKPNMNLVSDNVEVHHTCGLKDTNGSICGECYDWLKPAENSKFPLENCALHARD